MMVVALLLLFINILLFAAQTEQCRLNALPKAIPLAYAPLDGRLSLIRVPFFRNGVAYVLELSTKWSVPTWREQQQQRPAFAAAGRLGDLRYGRVIGIPDSFALGYMSPITSIAQSYFVGEVLVPAPTPTGDQQPPERYYYDDASKFLQEVESWKDATIHSVLYRVNQIAASDPVRECASGEEVPPLGADAIGIDGNEMEAAAPVCTVDVYVQYNGFKHFKEQKSNHFLRRQQQPQQQQIGSQLANQKQQLQRDDEGEKRAKRQVKGLAVLLVQTLNNIYAPHALAFETRTLVVFDDKICHPLEEEDSSEPNARSPSLFSDADKALMCNYAAPPAFNSLEEEKAHASRLLNSFSALRSVRRSNACLSVLYTAGELQQVLGKAKLARDPLSGVCARQDPATGNRSSVLVVELKASECHLHPLAELVQTNGHEVGHSLSLTHTDDNFLMAKQTIAEFNENYYQLSSGSASQLRRFLSLIKKERRWKDGNPFPNCFQ